MVMKSRKTAWLSLWLSLHCSCSGGTPVLIPSVGLSVSQESPSELCLLPPADKSAQHIEWQSWRGGHVETEHSGDRAHSPSSASGEDSGHN